MKKNSKVAVLELLKGEIRTFLAFALLILISVGIGFAAEAKNIVFDFGTGLSSEIASGSTPVNGGASLYPKKSGDITYGWKTPYVAEQSSGAAVSDLLETDSNQGAGDNDFIISGLSSSYYLVTLVSGNLNNSITTKVVVNGVTYLANSEAGVWKTLTFKTSAKDGSITFSFKRYGTNLWAVNAITLAAISTPPADPTFDVAVVPADHIVKAGGEVIYKVVVTPNNNYSSDIDLSLSGLSGEVSASFVPATGIPPFSSNLVISTSKNTPVTSYGLTISVKGHDASAYSINKNISLTVVPETSDLPDISTNVIPSKTSVTKQDAVKIQKLVDSYLVAEKKSTLTEKELLSLESLPVQLSVPILEQFPDSRGVVDSSLRGLTNAGIIDVVVDSAPRAEVPEEQKGFWAQFFGSMFNPAR